MRTCYYSDGFQTVGLLIIWVPLGKFGFWYIHGIVVSQPCHIDAFVRPYVTVSELVTFTLSPIQGSFVSACYLG
jgi:hypothetical protein